MRNILILVSAVIFSGCAILPANAQPAITSAPPDYSEELKRLEEEQRRTGVEVGKVRALIESDQLEGLYSLLLDIVETQRDINLSLADVKANQTRFEETLAGSEDRMTAKISDAAQWKNSQTIGVGASGVGIVGLGALVMRKKKGG